MIVLIRNRTFGRLLKLKEPLGRMTHDKINAAKNVPGSTAYQKNVLQNFNQLNKNKENGSKKRINIREESKEWQKKNNDIIDNNENKDKVK